ncbi:unnamed protein product [Periconia digitata]|uniref:O-methyltransferase n=1 Tax=Periconia digitata TaxID=1303443 RepID=A0A9W4XMI0_9PLEO|nr:unnamed protein product [Periconia digitata]
MARSSAAQTSDLNSLLGILNKAIPDVVSADPRSYEEARIEAIRACEKMTALLHDPFQWLFVESAAYIVPAAMSVVLELKVPHHISSDIENPTTVEQLSKATGAPVGLLERMLRILTKRMIFEEIKPKTYIHNMFSETILVPSVEAWVSLSSDDNLKAAAALLPLLKENGFKIPQNDGNCAFSKAFQTPLNQFQYYFDVDPERSRRAALSMAAFNSTSMFRDFPFPFDQLPQDGVVVDVGGGGGHVSVELARKYPHLNFVVQDLGESIASGAANPEYATLPIKWQEHGLFEPQAVKGADAYIVRHVLHGFEDETSSKIIGYIAKAMEPGKSRILIIDCVVPKAFGSDSIPFVNATDILAMLGGNGKQRTVEAWDALVKMADKRLEVVKIWQQGHLASADAVIEIRTSRV